MKYLMMVLMLWSFSVVAKPVNVNTADAQTISQSLKGIGLKKADAIVQYRKANGRFKSVKGLLRVKGIGEKTILKNKDDILLTDQKNRADSTSKQSKKAK